MAIHSDRKDSRESYQKACEEKAGGPFISLASQDSKCFRENISFETEEVCLPCLAVLTQDVPKLIIFSAASWLFLSTTLPSLHSGYADLLVVSGTCQAHSYPRALHLLFSVWNTVGVYVLPSLTFLRSLLKCRLLRDPPWWLYQPHTSSHSLQSYPALFVF